MTGLLLLSVFVFGYAMLAESLSKTPITAPMLFLGFGFSMSQTNLMAGREATEALHFVAEVTLVVLLFLDAARTDLRSLRRQHIWPARMLLLGIPLSITVGALTIMPIRPNWLIAAYLASSKHSKRCVGTAYEERQEIYL